MSTAMTRCIAWIRDPRTRCGLTIAIFASAIGGRAAPVLSQTGEEAAKRVALAEMKKLSGTAPGAIPPNLQLGTPAKEYFVRLDQLARYKADQNPRSLLSGGTRLIFPAIAAGPGGAQTVRSSIVVEEQEGQWRFVRTNHPAAAALTAFRTHLLQITGSISGPGKLAAPPSPSVVHVLGLNQYYLALDIEGRFLLQLLDNQLAVTGEAESAQRVFARLAPLAAKVDTRFPSGYERLPN